MAQKTRASLHEILVAILGSENVYFAPPSNIQMKHPCIIYHLASLGGDYADNRIYLGKRRWTLTVITKDPDSKIPNELQELPYCSYDRQYRAEGLYHHSLTLYY